jgi:hypothetical protein
LETNPSAVIEDVKLDYKNTYLTLVCECKSRTIFVFLIIETEFIFVFTEKDMAPIRRIRNKRSRKEVVSRASVLNILRSVAERKAFNGIVTAQATSNSGTVWPITQGIVQGDSVITRDGAEITLQNVRLKLDVFMPTATIAAGVRVIMFSDTQNNGSMPAFLDVLTANSLIAPYSVIQQVTNRFRIHADITKNLTAGGIQQVVVDINKKLEQKVFYTGTTDVPAANGKNAVFFLIVTDVATGFPTYDFAYNVRFLDM